MTDRRKKVCFVTASPFVARVFLTEHVNVLAQEYDVTLICNRAESDVPLALAPGVRFLSVGIERAISPWRDIAALWRLVHLFRRERFDLVHSVSPKSGMLAQIAALLARVPHRVHTFTGQVWATKTGAARWALKSIDRLFALCATHVLVDSVSQMHFLLEQGVIPKDKARVLGNGSISGVDIARFVPDPRAHAEVRAETGIPIDAVLFLYLGRLKREKGVLDLADAFSRHAAASPRSWLLCVGPDEEDIAAEIRRRCAAAADRLRIVAFTPAPERFLAAADVLCMPSYREGFGSVVIEAAACGVPAIGSRIYGLTDAVVEGETGALHEPGDAAAIASLLDRFAADPALRRRMGSAARGRALRSFPREVLTGALVRYYEAIFSISKMKSAKTDGYDRRHS